MKQNVALQRYLERHIEPGLPDAPQGPPQWQHVLVIPVYDESPSCLCALAQISSETKTLVILVLNRPDSDGNTEANTALRTAVARLDLRDTNVDQKTVIYRINESIDLFCYDLEAQRGASPATQGVGLARKTGCDLALLWQSQGAISGEWICSSDADATLPSDYFSRLGKLNHSAAATYPFIHSPGMSADINRATALYEIRLHLYVLGLNHAQSPYAYHTLGSCIAVKSNCYAQVRGYPKRSGGEDFYLLNKVAKIGPVASLSGECISIQSRASHRVPFGTGPATQKIIDNALDMDSTLFYHPQCFEALRAVLAVVEQLQEQNLDELAHLLIAEGLCEKLTSAATDALLAMGLEKAVAHCRKQGKSSEQFLRQFHQWFDGFKTLKFIHAIRDSGWPMQNLTSMVNLQPRLLPEHVKQETDLSALRAAIRQHWRWTITP